MQHYVVKEIRRKTNIVAIAAMDDQKEYQRSKLNMDHSVFPLPVVTVHTIIIILIDVRFTLQSPSILGKTRTAFLVLTEKHSRPARLPTV